MQTEHQKGQKKNLNLIGCRLDTKEICYIGNNDIEKVLETDKETSGSTNSKSRFAYY